MAQVPTTTYTVKPGDTLSAIASRYGVGVNQISGYSSGNPNLIRVGENLTIPSFGGGSSGGHGASGSWGAPSTPPPSSGGGGSKTTTTNNQQPAGTQTLQNNIQNQVDMLGEIINRDYESTMGTLSGQEGSLRGAAATATSGVESMYAPAKTELKNALTTNLGGLETEASTANRQAGGALQQARDLYQQINLANNAKLAALGISSSSVSEALAERLGVETARRIAGVTGSRDEILQNIEKENTRVNTYFNQKMADLEQGVAQEKSNIQQKLLEGINQINSARNQAANDKANARTSLLSNAQNALANLQAQTLNFQQSLEAWKVQQSSSLASAKQFVFSPQDFSGLSANAKSVSELPTVGGFQAVPTYGTNAQGWLTPGISYVAKPKEQDLQIGSINPNNPSQIWNGTNYVNK